MTFSQAQIRRGDQIAWMFLTPCPPHFCCDEETAWVSVRFGVKTAVGCIRTVGTLSAGTNPKVQKYGGPALWNGGIVVRTDDGNIVNGFHDVDRPGEWVHV